jgi:UbiD family decarboxylase
MVSLSVSHDPTPIPNRVLYPDLRGYLEANSDVELRITKPVSMNHIPELIGEADQPVLFENIIEKPDFRLCDILVKDRSLQARALGVPRSAYLKTLAYRLRKPPRGFVQVKDGPVKAVKLKGKDCDWTRLPVPIPSQKETLPYVTAMNIVVDPETGFYNSSHAGTNVTGPNRGLVSFATPHTHIIMRKYREMGIMRMPIVMVFGLPPAYEIMANFSGMHMDQWGEMEMVGTIMDRDIEMVPCETLDISVPAHAEIVVEGTVDLSRLIDARRGEPT